MGGLIPLFPSPAPRLTLMADQTCFQVVFFYLYSNKATDIDLPHTHLSHPTTFVLRSCELQYLS